MDWAVAVKRAWEKDITVCSNSKAAPRFSRCDYRLPVSG
jgi:hypothetical protein